MSKNKHLHESFYDTMIKMNQKEKNILLSVPNISGNELKYVKECLETADFSAGSYVDKFGKWLQTMLVQIQ